MDIGTEAAREVRVFLCILASLLTWQLGIAWPLISVCCSLIDSTSTYSEHEYKLGQL